jgi:hypothetical protein
MQMVRHNDVFKDIPVASSLTMFNGFDQHLSDRRLREMRRPFRAVEPPLHFCKDQALQT